MFESNVSAAPSLGTEVRPDCTAGARFPLLFNLSPKAINPKVEASPNFYPRQSLTRLPK